MFDNHWGEGISAEALFGEAASMPGVREMMGRYERASASPVMPTMLVKAMAEIDVRDILPTIHTNALVLSWRPGDQVVPIEASEALAAALPNATFRALPPGAHGAFDIDDSLATETLNFLGGPLKSPTSERVLATVLFTDIVGSHRTAEQPRRFAVAASTRTDGAQRSPHRCDGRRRRSADQPDGARSIGGVGSALPKPSETIASRGCRKTPKSFGSLPLWTFRFRASSALSS